MSEIGLIISAMFLLASYFNERHKNKLALFGCLFLVAHIVGVLK